MTDADRVPSVRRLALTRESMPPRSCLIVDEDVEVVSSLASFLEKAMPYLKVEPFMSPIFALQRLRDHRFHVIIAELKMPGLNGARFLQRAHAMQPDAYRILMTRDGSYVMSEGNAADLCLLKPLNTEPFLNRMREILESQRR